MDNAEGALETLPVAEGILDVATRQIQVGNTFGIRVKGFRDRNAAQGIYLDAADPKTWDLRTAANGAGTSAASGNLAYTTGSNGEYTASIPAATNLTVGTTYYLRITLTEGSVTLLLDVPLEAVARTGYSPTT